MIHGAARWPDWVTATALGLLFANVGVLLAQRAGPGEAALIPYLLLVVPATYWLVVRREPLIWSWPTTLVLAFVGAGLMSTVFSDNPNQSMATMAEWILEGLLFFIAVTNSVRSLAALRLCTAAIVLAGAFVAFVVAYQNVRGNFYNQYFGFGQMEPPYDITSAESSPLEDLSVEGTFRAGGMIGETNYFAMIMISLVPWAGYLSITARSVLARLFWGGCGLLVLYAVLLAYSRGSLAATALVLIALAILGVLPRRTFWYLLLAGSIALAVIPALAARLATLSLGNLEDDASALGRFSEVIAAVRAYADRPLVGLGPGQFPYFYHDYAGVLAGGIHDTSPQRVAHNLVAGLAADLGTVGLLVFLVLIAVVLTGLLHARQAPQLKVAAVAGITSLALYMACSLFLALGYARYLWLYVALSAAIVFLSRRSDSQASSNLVVAPAAMEGVS